MNTQEDLDGVGVDRSDQGQPTVLLFLALCTFLVSAEPGGPRSRVSLVHFLFLRVDWRARGLAGAMVSHVTVWGSSDDLRVQRQNIEPFSSLAMFSPHLTHDLCSSSCSRCPASQCSVVGQLLSHQLTLSSHSLSSKNRLKSLVHTCWDTSGASSRKSCLLTTSIIRKFLTTGDKKSRGERAPVPKDQGLALLFFFFFSVT